MTDSLKTEQATLSTKDTDYTFDVMDGAVGPSVIDVSKLYAQTGQFTYDPGLYLNGQLPFNYYLY